MTADVDRINGKWRVSMYRDRALVDRVWFNTEIAARAFADAWRDGRMFHK